MEFQEEQKPQEKIKPNKKRKKHDVRLSKITNKDILENSNKRKEKQNGLSQPDIANMQANVEFIQQQIAQSARSKESHKYNELNPSVQSRKSSGNEKMTNEKKAVREQENMEQFSVKNTLHPSKQDMVNYMFAQREARGLDKNNHKQRQINNLYNQIQRKKVNNNISKDSKKSINNQKDKKKQR